MSYPWRYVTHERTSFITIAASRSVNFSLWWISSWSSPPLHILHIIIRLLITPKLYSSARRPWRFHVLVQCWGGPTCTSVWSHWEGPWWQRSALGWRPPYPSTSLILWLSVEALSQVSWSWWPWQHGEPPFPSARSSKPLHRCLQESRTCQLPPPQH